MIYVEWAAAGAAFAAGVLTILALGIPLALKFAAWLYDLIEW